MKVAIAGGHGKVGMRLTRLLHERGHDVVSLIRKPEDSDDVRSAGGEPVVCDLEHAGAGEARDAIEGTDAVVFAAGAGPGSGPERKMTMDYGGAVKLIEAAQAAGVTRYVMISSQGADPGNDGDDTFSVYLRAKGLADAALEASGLEHTIVRPTFMNDEPGKGTVEVAPHVERSEISRDEVALVLRATLEAPNTIGKTFEVGAGDTPADEAVASIR
jgi:uncharacterized protein YbjT (DUF2867 family)